MRIRNRRQKRRGILLLLVLSLLVLFVLVGTTFIIVAGHYNSASTIYAKHERTGEDPSTQLDNVVLDLIKGAKTFSSPLAHHNLLNDTYGTDGFVGVVSSVAIVGNGQLIQIEFAAFSPLMNPGSNASDPSDDTELLGKRTPELGQRATAFQAPDYYAGSLLTMLTGPAKNKSVRILRYTPPTRIPTSLNADSFPDYAGGVMVLEAFDGLLIPPVNALSTRQFLVNGRPQSGTGAGYDPTAGTLKQTVDFGLGDLELALLPFFERRINPFTGLPFIPAAPFTVYDPDLAIGGLDEGWDAADYQNVFLGMTPDPTLILTAKEPHRHLEALNIPSFHRPFLVNYWAHRENGRYSLLMDSTIGPPTRAKVIGDRFRRSIIARPLASDHPRFNGSNPVFSHPGFNNDGTLVQNIYNKDGDQIPDFMDSDVFDDAGAISTSGGGDGNVDDLRLVTGRIGSDGLADMPIVSGPWDVDNDNDGTPDSIWLDLGHSIQSTKDGRLYKPLFAVLCVDLDGRLNVNAHGSVDQLEAAAYPLINGGPLPITNSAAAIIPGATYVPSSNAIPANIDTLWGQGYGPPDVSLSRAFFSLTNGDLGLAVDRFESVLARRLFGKGIPGTNNEVFNRPSGHFPGPGRQATPDGSTETPWSEPVNYLSEVGVPVNYLAGPNSFMTPPDLRGRSTLLADRHGQPFYFKLPQVFTQSIDVETVNDPYETNLVDPNAYDSIYSVTELEAVYRYYDLDSTNLDQRLATAIGVANWGKLFTTRSSSMSTSTTAMHPAAREDALTLTQALINELNDHPSNAGVVNPSWLEQQVVAMLPRELRAGRKMDINRLFGDGIDDPTNGLAGIVDDPFEFDTDGNSVVDAADTDAQFLWRDLFGTNVPGRFFHPVTDSAGNPSIIPIPTYAPARQIYARQLYCLAMLLLKDFDMPVADPGMSQLDRDKAKARRLAQWAINVVDFRDADSIMTPFEFDLDPFANGWDADGDLKTANTNSEIVWGVEQPELLITETVAIHDRGVRDLDTEIPDDGEMAKLVTDMMDPDDDLDQYKKPQGSLFLELLCPRSPRWNRTDNVHSYGNELYTKTATDVGLDLGRFVAGSAPVWRVAIVQHETPNDSFEVQLQANPAMLDILPRFPETSYDRIIWFANLVPTATNATRPGIVYYNAAVTAPLLPGSWQLLGRAQKHRSVHRLGPTIKRFGWWDGFAISSRETELISSQVFLASIQQRLADRF